MARAAAKQAEVARYVALLRGINVGRAKRISMAELRALVESLGYEDVRTLLNSGNVVFTAPRGAKDAAARIETGLAKKLGVTARVTVLSSKELADVIGENPLTAECARNPSLFLCTVLNTPADRAKLKTLSTESWAPEKLVVGKRAAYLWCPGGSIKGRIFMAVDRALAGAGTSRNWATMLKLQALTES